MAKKKKSDVTGILAIQNIEAGFKTQKRFGIKQFDHCFEKLKNNKPFKLGLKEY